MKAHIGFAIWITGLLGTCVLVGLAVVSIAEVAYETWNVWAAVAVFSTWPVSVVIGSIAVAFGGVWLPLAQLAGAAACSFFGWLLYLILGWN